MYTRKKPRINIGRADLRLSGFQKVLWVMASIALLAFAGFQVTGTRTNQDAVTRDPAFRAAFKLTDHRGMVQTEEDFSGRWMLIFFGFANCPDVCPTTLSEVSVVMESLGEEANKVQPIFISIDPQRDTPSVLAQFVPPFDAGIIGLTGTTEQIAETAGHFPIYFERLEETTAPDGYTVSHSSHLFLFGPEADFVTSWAYGTTAEETLADLKERI